MNRKVNKGLSHTDQIIEFFKNNPNPKDDAVHQLADDLDMSPDALETEVYSILSSFISGGKSKGKKVNVDPGELKEGMRIELEHTNDPDLAEKIARDHLAEDKKYYTKLKTIEKGKVREMKIESIVAKARIEAIVEKAAGIQKGGKGSGRKPEHGGGSSSSELRPLNPKYSKQTTEEMGREEWKKKNRGKYRTPEGKKKENERHEEMRNRAHNFRITDPDEAWSDQTQRESKRESERIKAERNKKEKAMKARLDAIVNKAIGIEKGGVGSGRKGHTTHKPQNVKPGGTTHQIVEGAGLSSGKHVKLTGRKHPTDKGKVEIEHENGKKEYFPKNYLRDKRTTTTTIIPR